MAGWKTPHPGLVLRPGSPFTAAISPRWAAHAGSLFTQFFSGTDNAVTVAALDQLGEGFRGIGLLPDTASEADLNQFAAWNMVVSGSIMSTVACSVGTGCKQWRQNWRRATYTFRC